MKAPLFPFLHENVLQTAMPLGGIGAGCLCFNGYGGIQDIAVKGLPYFSALPDDWTSRDSGFALLRTGGAKPAARLVEGPLPPGKIYDQGLQAQGYRQGGYEGLPRFRKSRFRSGYPFGQVTLTDPGVPLRVEVTAWSPFIPLDDIASGLPCAILEYTLSNHTAKAVDFDFSYHLSHFAVPADKGPKESRNAVLPGRGILFSNTEAGGTADFGSATLSLVGHRPQIKAMWPRGGWFDTVSTLWRECESGRFSTNDGKAGAGLDGRNGGSVRLSGSLRPGASLTIPVVICWHFPNRNLTIGGANGAAEKTEAGTVPRWRAFYASQWPDAAAVAGHVHRHFSGLRERTVAFQRALLGSSLPIEALDAVSGNLAILKSPTVLRQENGNLWGWEGCFTQRGSCHGSCTHVWNYAQSLCHLFPGLERTLREQELERSMDERGHVTFRAALPDGPPPHDYHAAADGQLGGIMKLHRDWHISGDTAWMRHLYPLARRSLEYGIRTWDPQRQGALFEPHHNTYDIEFWGPDGMCTSIYVGALAALAAMASALGEKEDADAYGALAAKGAAFMENELFNGEYFEQKVTYRGLADTSFVEALRQPDQRNRDVVAILKKEGPKYQYGTGCISDGVIGAWMASLYGIETPLDRAKVRKNLRAIHRHNFRRSLNDHANCQRSGYAMGDEPGLLLCSWPRGKKPTLPFVYSDEVWTGIEYQVASHLIAEGHSREGMEIVKAVRSRYDGAVRNPWNEYECGSYYARAMASYALLGTLSGFRYSAVEQTLWLSPRTEAKSGPFRVFFSTASGYGTLSLDRRALTIDLLEGTLDCRRIVIGEGPRRIDLRVHLSVRSGKPLRIPLKKRA